MANVKGSALTSRVLWVRLGTARREKRSCSLRSRRSCGRTSSAASRKRSGIRSTSSSSSTSRSIALFGRGDLGLVKQLGRFGADANLTTIYRLFFKVGSPSWILSRTLRLWSAHYDSGYAEITTRGPNGAVLRIRGVATRIARTVCRWPGWAERSIELSGGERAFVEESRCRTAATICVSSMWRGTDA